jgi:luciferase family oxidoreductase group 1
VPGEIVSSVTIALGILDQSPVVAGNDAEGAIAATIELVKRAETLGYGRYWFAEHHGRTHGFASASPELLIARVAAETSRMRLGSGGVLLSHYSPLKVAENFRLLEAFAPGRIDLGVGRGTGSDEPTEHALNGGTTGAIPYARRVEELLSFLGAGFAADHRYAATSAAPVLLRSPQPWILGSTTSGAQLAAAFGIPFAYAHFINGDEPAITAAYRAAYRPSAAFPAPRVLVTVAAYSSPDARERDEFLSTLVLRRARMKLEHDPLPPSSDEALRHVPTVAQREQFADTRRLAIVASPGEIRRRLEDVAQRHGADEVLIVTVAPDDNRRMRSYETIAGAATAVR